MDEQGKWKKAGMQGWAVDALPTPMCHETDIHVACGSLLTNLFTCQLFWVSETPHIKCQALNTGPSPEVCSERNGSKMDRGGKKQGICGPKLELLMLVFILMMKTEWEQLASLHCGALAGCFPPTVAVVGHSSPSLWLESLVRVSTWCLAWTLTFSFNQKAYQRAVKWTFHESIKHIW